MDMTYTLGTALKVTLATDKACFGLAPDDLFELAVRQNDKRPFLFVSKVLGKHLPVHPAVLLSAGRLLALAWTGGSGWEPWVAMVKGATPPPFVHVLEDLDKSRQALDVPTLFIGFAETATGLARAVVDSFSGDLRYVSTTRATLPGPVPLTFEEAHSHARTHRLHLDPSDPFLKRCRRAVLVDDELTTGRTALRLVEQLYLRFGIREFVLLTLLNNSEEEERVALAQRLGITIQLHALIQGRILDMEVGQLPPPLPCEHPTAEVEFGIVPVSDQSDDRRPRSFEELQAQREFIRTHAENPDIGGLFLGTGEFIYLPALLAGYCGSTSFQSTTQSPVLPLDGSAIVSGARFYPIERYSSAGYLYNVPASHYSYATVVSELPFTRQQGLEELVLYLQDQGIEDMGVFMI